MIFFSINIYIEQVYIYASSILKNIRSFCSIFFFYYNKVYVSIRGPLDIVATTKIVDVKLGLFYRQSIGYLFGLIILRHNIVFIIDVIIGMLLDMFSMFPFAYTSYETSIPLNTSRSNDPMFINPQSTHNGKNECTFVHVPTWYLHYSHGF